MTLELGKERLRWIMEKMDVTCAELAADLKVSPGAVERAMLIDDDAHTVIYMAAEYLRTEWVLRER